MPACAFLAAVLISSTGLAAGQDWVGTWGCGVQLTEPGNMPPPPGLASNTLRQVVHATIGGKQLRLRFSNLFGTTAVTLNSVQVALDTGEKTTSSINTASDKQLTFGGKTSVSIPSGQELTSDPIDFNLPPLANLAVTIHFGEVPAKITGHPGSRTTSYILPGDEVTAASMANAAKTAHWYFIENVEVPANSSNQALVVLGDSITDGRGSTTDGNDRWPDDLAARFQTNAATANIGILNMGIGGNGIFGGLGPAAKKRFDRDVLNQSGVRWLISFEGVNDIGGSHSPGIATNLIDAYQQFIAKAHAKDIKVYCATITPFGTSFYDSPMHAAEREQVNAWIRTNQVADAVIDFDVAVRDPGRPAMLKPAYDSGDHLHLSPVGYHTMADVVNTQLFLK